MEHYNVTIEILEKLQELFCIMGEPIFFSPTVFLFLSSPNFERNILMNGDILSQYKSYLAFIQGGPKNVYESI